MRFLNALFDSLAGFVQRNPLTVLFILLLALLAPSLLRGAAMLLLYALLGILLTFIILALVFVWRVRSAQRQMEEQFRRRFDGGAAPNGSAGFTDQQRTEHRGRRPYNNPQEGEVKIYRTSDIPEKRVANDVGDYVEFEETKNK